MGHGVKKNVGINQFGFVQQNFTHLETHSFFLVKLQQQHCYSPSFTCKISTHQYWSWKWRRRICCHANQRLILFSKPKRFFWPYSHYYIPSSDVNTSDVPLIRLYISKKNSSPVLPFSNVSILCQLTISTKTQLVISMVGSQHRLWRQDTQSMTNITVCHLL